MFGKRQDAVQESLPNKFSKAMGALIRQARRDEDLTQTELADLIYRNQAAVSDMENGKMVPNAITLMYMAGALSKPVGYFFPSPWIFNPDTEDLSAQEQELLLQFRRIRGEEHRKIAVNQVRSLADLETR